MARKVGVLDLHQGQSSVPITYIKNSVAKLLVRRLLADWIVKNYSIRYRDAKTSLVKGPIKIKRRKSIIYQHHIEPHIERFNESNNEWMAYLNGFGRVL